MAAGCANQVVSCWRPSCFNSDRASLTEPIGHPAPVHANVAGLLNLALEFGHKSEACWEPETMSRILQQFNTEFPVGLFIDFAKTPSAQTEARVLRSEPSTDGREQCWNWRARSPGQWHGVRGMHSCFSVASAGHLGLEVKGCRI